VKGNLAALVETNPRVEQAISHVIEDALMLGQEELLEDEADTASSKSG
jgi:hypothetical protein